MIQLCQVQTSSVENGREENDGEADDEGGDRAGMMHGYAVDGRCGLCR